MITTGIGYIFGPGASFRRRDGEVVEFAKFINQLPYNTPVMTDALERYRDGRQYQTEESRYDLIEQLTLPYDAAPIELAVGQMWPVLNSRRRKVEIVYMDLLGVAFNNDGVLDSCSIDEFHAYVRIPKPAVRPKRKVVTKLWVSKLPDGQFVVERTEALRGDSLSETKVPTGCLGYIHGSEEESEVEG